MNYTGPDVYLSSGLRTASGRAEELQYLDTLNRSYNTVVIVIVAVFLNLYYVYGIRLQLIDTIYGTDYSKNIIDPKSAQSLANYLFIYATTIFVQINLEEYSRVTSEQQGNTASTTSQLDIENAYKGVITAILAFVASIISRTVINSENDADVD